MKKEVKIILVIFIILISLVIGYFIGYKRSYDKIESASQTTSYTTNQQTFYAKIKEINDNSILVQGLSINDINHRGEFIFSIIEETELVWRGTEIKLYDLDIGDNISITFNGEILDSYPAQIKDVTKIQLLDDEK